MPMIILPESIAQLTFQGTHDGQQVMTVMSYKSKNTAIITNGRPVLESLLNIAAQPLGLYEKYLACISSDVKAVVPYVQLVANARYAYITPAGAGTDGDIAGPCMPANTAQVVTRRGEIADRRNISSLHLPGVPVAAVVDSFLTAVHMAKLQEFGTASCQAIVTSDGTEWQPVAYRRTSPGDSRQLVEAYVQNTVRVVRRRTVGLGA